MLRLRPATCKANTVTNNITKKKLLIAAQFAVLALDAPSPAYKGASIKAVDHPNDNISRIEKAEMI